MLEDSRVAGGTRFPVLPAPLHRWWWGFCSFDTSVTDYREWCGDTAQKYGVLNTFELAVSFPVLYVFQHNTVELHYGGMN
jgi:hypothetical protein